MPPAAKPTEPEKPSPHDVARLTEIVRMRRRRYQEAVDAGWTKIEAQLFADSDIDVGELRRLVRDGCPPHLAAAILL
jgi:hypothetical protein